MIALSDFSPKSMNVAHGTRRNLTGTSPKQGEPRRKSSATRATGANQNGSVLVVTEMVMESARKVLFKASGSRTGHRTVD